MSIIAGNWEDRVDARSPRAELLFSLFSLALCAAVHGDLTYSSEHNDRYEGDWVIMWIVGQ